MFRSWITRSLQRRLLVSLLLGVGVTLAVFQFAVDHLVDHYIINVLDARGIASGERNELLREVDVILLGGLLTVLATGAIAMVLAVRRGLRPLERVALAAQEISVERDARALPLAGVPEEIKPLGERFNQLIERLAEALEHERRFSSDLAHELRTPLAEIRALGEAGLGRDDVAGLHEFLRHTTAAAVAMQGVIESLLAVARADPAAVQQNLEPMLADVAIRERVERLRMASPADYARIETHVPEKTWVHSDLRLFDAMLLNLISNAVQHGDTGTPITIEWVQDARGGALLVRNRASQLTHADLPRLADRFWRRARQEATTLGAGPGLGLGLWIVARLCRVLNLTLALDLDAAQLLTVRLSGFRSLY